MVAWPQTNSFENVRKAQTQLGAGWIPPAKVAVVEQEVRRQCDALDGLTDGLIMNFRACTKLFDPTLVATPFANVRCAGGTDTGNTCLSDPQLATLNATYSPTSYSFQLGYGFSRFPGWEVGNQVSSTSLRNGPYLATQPSLTATNAPDAFITAAVGSTTFNSLLFRPEDYQAGVEYVASVVHATNPDLTQFMARGGKLVLKSNSADYTAPPRVIDQYYQSVVSSMGQASVDRFVRYYTASGAWHNRNLGFNVQTGDPVPFYFDAIAMVDDWVEDQVVPPDNPTATWQNPLPPFNVISSLPMCRFPTAPFYNGGDAKVAASYSCK